MRKCRCVYSETREGSRGKKKKKKKIEENGNPFTVNLEKQNVSNSLFGIEYLIIDFYEHIIIIINDQQ